MGLCLPFIDKRNANKIAGALSQSALSESSKVPSSPPIFIWQWNTFRTTKKWWICPDMISLFKSLIGFIQFSAFLSCLSTLEILGILRRWKMSSQIDICTAGPRPQSEHINKYLYVRFELFDSEILGKVLSIEMANWMNNYWFYAVYWIGTLKG